MSNVGKPHPAIPLPPEKPPGPSGPKEPRPVPPRDTSAPNQGGKG